MPNTPRRRRDGPSGAASSPAPAERGDEGEAPPAQGAPKRGTGRVLADGRVQMLVYLPPALVKAVKHTAVEHEVSASHVVEQALDEWFARGADPLRRAATPPPSAASTPTPTVNRTDRP